jgi:hypothetical protein
LPPTPARPRAAIFDGHGGSAAAQWLARNLHAALLPPLRAQLRRPSTPARLLNKLTGLSEPRELRSLLVEQFHAADTAVMSALDGGRCARLVRAAGWWRLAAGRAGGGWAAAGWHCCPAGGSSLGAGQAARQRPGARLSRS